MRIALSVQNLTRRFADFTAVNDVSFDVEDGKFFSILGPSGCGKSTELNKFLREYAQEFFPVKFSVLDQMTPNSVLAEDLILVIAEQVLSAAKTAGLNPNKSK